MKPSTHALVLGYRLIKPCGEGAYGEVWEARGPDGETVAVKIVRAGVSAISEQEREAVEWIRTHRHPGLIEIVAHGEIDGSLVIVMEWAPRTLATRFSERLRETGVRGLPPEELIPYMEEVAGGIDYLNDHGPGRGWTHNDIKPANILLSTRAKVADFGLAQLMTQTIDEQSGKYTPFFAAPEFFCKEVVSRRSDQYSLAVSYYWLRTGKHPLATLNEKSSIADVVIAYAERTPVVLEGLRDSETRALTRALSRNPRERYDTCAAFIRELAADYKTVAHSEQRTGALETTPNYTIAELRALLESQEHRHGAKLAEVRRQVSDLADLLEKQETRHKAERAETEKRFQKAQDRLVKNLHFVTATVVTLVLSAALVAVFLLVQPGDGRTATAPTPDPGTEQPPHSEISRLSSLVETAKEGQDRFAGDVASLRAELKGAADQLKSINAALESQKKSLTAVWGSVEQSREQFKGSSDELKGISNELKGLKGTHTTLATNVKTLQESVDKVTKAVETLGANLKDVPQTTTKLGKDVAILAKANEKLATDFGNVQGLLAELKHAKWLKSAPPPVTVTIGTPGKPFEVWVIGNQVAAVPPITPFQPQPRGVPKSAVWTYSLGDNFGPVIDLRKDSERIYVRGLTRLLELEAANGKLIK